MSHMSGFQIPMADDEMDGYSFNNDLLLQGASSQDHSAYNVPAVGSRFQKLPLSEEEAKATMQSILDIFELDEELPDGPGENEQDEDDSEPTINLEDQSRRIERLRSICPALDQLWWTGSDYMTGAAEKLADGCRDPRWRIPIGQSGILNSFLAILATEGVPQAFMVHVLRLIGNACADTDENRKRAVDQGSTLVIIGLLKEEALLPFVIPVLFNICVDYEPAQHQASEALLTQALIELISSPSIHESRAFIGYVTKLLDLVIEQPREIELAPENTPDVLLNLAFDPEFNADLDDFLALVSCAILYLRHERFQQAVIKTSGVYSCYRIMVFSYTRFEDTSAHIDPTSSDQDDAKRLSAMRNSMNQVLSDISALPEFSATFPVLSPLSSNLRRYLSSPQMQLQVMACIMLGNIARSDNACVEFVQKCQIHKPLIVIITEANDSQLLHAALGFLKNLALPLPNKLSLGDADLITILPRLWNMDALPQIQYSSISLARQLLSQTFENVRRICYHLSEDQSSPAYERTRLSILITLFQKTDAEPVKMEIARLLTAIVRTFTSPSITIRDVDRRRKQFFEYHPDVARPLSFMVSQKKWPVVRSEGWFVMALMARTPEGASCVADIMHDPQVFQPLVELLTGKSIIDGSPVSPPMAVDSPMSDISGSGGQILSQLQAQQSQPQSTSGSGPASTPTSSRETSMQRIDRENALVLVSELLRHCGPKMAAIRRSVFEDLLKGGGTMHLSYAQVKEREEFFDNGAMAQGPGVPSGGDGNRGGDGAGGEDKTSNERWGMHQVTEESVKEIMG